MARPGKSISEKIAIIDAKIEKLSAALKELKDSRKELEAQKDAQEFSELVNLMKEKNVSVADLKSLIQ